MEGGGPGVGERLVSSWGGGGVIGVGGAEDVVLVLVGGGGAVAGKGGEVTSLMVRTSLAELQWVCGTET